MARQDISVDPTYGEVATTDNLNGKAVCDFVLLEEFDGPYGAAAIYGEVLLPAGFAARYQDSIGIATRIGYLGSDKPLCLRLKTETPGGDTEYIFNTARRDPWFSLVRESGEGHTTPISASELHQINAQGSYKLLLREGCLAVYSGGDTDLQIKPSKYQNEVFLLKASAGNLYQHPTTGVGLIDFLHGNFENSGLAEKLQQEFENDRMIINNAYMNSETGELYLDVEERNG